MRGLQPAHNSLIMLVCLLLAACGPEAPPRTGQSVAPAAAQQTPLVAATPSPLLSERSPNPRAMGDPNAPIVMIEYGDYQCPFCAEFVREAKPQIEAEYVKTGKVYFEFRDLPLHTIHPGAVMAAHVANCAAEQNRFWPMHDRLIIGSEAREWGSGDAADFQTFLGYAGELQLDVGALQQCVSENRQARQIQTDVEQASDRGLRSTPAFVVNGRSVLGARPFDNWKRLFDQMLAE